MKFTTIKVRQYTEDANSIEINASIICAFHRNDLRVEFPCQKDINKATPMDFDSAMLNNEDWYLMISKPVEVEFINYAEQKLKSGNIVLYYNAVEKIYKFL